MMCKKILAGVLLLMLVPDTSSADVMRGIGNTMSFGIGYGIQINEGSTLLREWVIVNDDRLPINLTGFQTSTQVDDGRWIYSIRYEIEVIEDIQAIEVRFIPFDIWGESGRTLSATEIKDIGPGAENFSAIWRIISENEATQHYAMLGYVAQVKLASGAILRANTDAVVEEARRFSEDFTSGDLSTEE